MASDANNKITQSSVHGVVVQGRDINQINVVNTTDTVSVETEIWRHRYKACTDLFCDWQAFHDSLERYLYEWQSGDQPKGASLLPGKLEALGRHSATLQVLGLYRFDFTIMLGWAEGILGLIDIAPQHREVYRTDRACIEEASRSFKIVENIMIQMEIHIRKVLGT
ncbi:hypothetical protein ACFVFQ_31705 [Streptomyces sp. NPDC057743]|uniref:hypothetical protein n=1 Tax=Streptomyces sp. NPDC057743 TaxID=3346236 RepID=UPI0036C53A68